MKRSEVVDTINSFDRSTAHEKVLEIYNSQEEYPRGYKLQAKDPWCAATVSAVFILNGYDALSEVSCIMMVDKAIKRGLWVEADDYRPEPGDIIMYDWQDNGRGDDVGTPDHTGIVVKVSGDKITVREGNKNNSIGNRTLDVNGRNIRGYIVPPYEEYSELAEPEKEPEDLPYVVGDTYTVSVHSALNVRKGPGKSNGLVGYKNLTSNAKKHATGSGALLNGTRVTCYAVQKIGNEIWMQIPSGWICAQTGNDIYVR